MPIFKLLFSRDCFFCVWVLFKINKFFKFVFFCKSINHFVFMFMDSAYQIIGYTDIKSCVVKVGEYVNVIGLLHKTIIDPETSLRP